MTPGGVLARAVPHRVALWYAVAAGTVAASACFTELQPLLFLTIESQIPDTTAVETLNILGQVVRSPPKQGLTMVVMVTGGAATAADTANPHGVFSVPVPLRRNAQNHLVIKATDDTGAESDPLARTVTHVNPSASPR